jgi:hypothetical protein
MGRASAGRGKDWDQHSNGKNTCDQSYGAMPKRFRYWDRRV